MLLPDALQRVIQLLQIVLSVIFQFDPALALAGDDPDLAAKTGGKLLFAFRQIIHLRQLGLGRLRLESPYRAMLLAALEEEKE